MSNNEPAKKTHWYLLSFMVASPGLYVPTSFMGSFTSKLLTMPAIHAMREAQGIPENAILMHFSYVGYMSKDHLTGTKAKPEQTVMSEGYRQGLTAALSVPAGVTPSNPYEHIAGDSAEMAEYASEWGAGYVVGEAIRRDTAILAPQPSQSVVT